MPKRRYDNWLREYMRFTAHSESPDPFHFWTGVSMIAGALRRRVWIDEGIFQWTPNFYIIFVAPPGVAAKSTSAAIGGSILRRIEGIHHGPNSMTWQGLTLALEEAIEVLEHDGRFWHMSCITCIVSELGTFLKTKDKDLLEVLTDLWDGRLTQWKHKVRTAEEVIIRNPWINILGCTTPAWMRDNYPNYMIEGGLTSRVVFVHGDKKRRLVAYPSDEINPQAFESYSEAMAEDLNRIAEMAGPYELTTEAKIWGREWYHKHWEKRPEGMLSDRYGGYVSRKQTHLHKLAMVLAAAQRDQLIITPQDMDAANRVLTALEVDMQKIFEHIGVADIAKQTQEILVHIRAYGLISLRDLWRLFMHRMDRRMFDDALKSLLRASYIAEIPTADGPGLKPIMDRKDVQPDVIVPPVANDPPPAAAADA